MSTSYSTNLALALPATGELSGTWGTTVNTNITNMLDEALGYQAYSATGGADTITIPDGTTGVARSIYIQLNGTGGGSVAVPATKTKMYFVFNNTSSAITFKVTGQTGVSIPAAAKMALVSNGTDVIVAQNYFAALTLGAALPVASGGTGLTAGTSGGVLAYTATGTLASSAALAASALVIGGGAGAAPSTTTTGTGVVTALGVNTGTAGAFVVNGGALGTPSSGTVTNLTGTASININGTVGATTPTTGAFTTLSATGTATLGTGLVSYALGGGSAAAAGLTDKDITLRAWSVSSGTNDYSGDLILQSGVGTGNGSGKLGSVIIKAGNSGASSSILGALTTIGTFSSTGLAVTGTLSATGRSGVTMSGQTSAVSLGQVSTDPTYGLLSFNGAFAATTLTGIWGGAGSPDMIIGVPTGGSIYSRVNNSTVTLLSSTGLAVTGTLSSTLGANLATSSGSVGVGNSSPQALLHVGSVVEAPGFGTASQMCYVNGTVQPEVLVRETTNNVVVSMFADSTSGAIRTATNHPLIFYTNNTERARIGSNGYSKFSNVGTYNDTAGNYHEFRGDTQNSYVVITACTNATPLSEFIQDFRFSAATPNDGNARFWSCTDATAERAYIRSNGGLSNYSANDTNLSDRREKTNFAPATSYLDKICAIPVQTFNYIDQNHGEDGGLTLGVVAQDVQAVAPELVTESNWGSKEEPKMRLSIYQTDLQYALMKCIQEQQALITQLTARVAQLESKPS